MSCMLILSLYIYEFIFHSQLPYQIDKVPILYMRKSNTGQVSHLSKLMQLASVGTSLDRDSPECELFLPFTRWLLLLPNNR